MGLDWAKTVGDIALEIKKRYQNKAAYIGCVMTIGVAVIVHGSSFMETTDHLPMEVTGTCTLESTVHFAVSVNDSSLKENTDNFGYGHGLHGPVCVDCSDCSACHRHDQRRREF